MAKLKDQDALDLLAADYEHVGRHRARRTAKERWLELLTLSLASIILSTVGYFGLQYASDALSQTHTIKHVVHGVDYSTPITVIDGSGTRKYAASIGQMLLDAQMVVPYSRTIDQRLATSSIYIQKSDYRPLAKKIQGILGNLAIKVVANSKYPIEVRLGTDFSPPTQ